MGEEKSQVLPDLYKELPFMESFPFPEYSIELEQAGTGPEELGVDPFLIARLGSFGTNLILNIYHTKGENSTIISINIEEVLYISEISDRVKKMTPVKEIIDWGLESIIIKEKIEALRKTKKFVKLLEENAIVNPAFDLVLDQLLSLSKIQMSPGVKNSIISRNLTRLNRFTFTQKQTNTILDFYDFQLHYAKILLGIIIAAKIH
jgi:hypothetical protein